MGDGKTTEFVCQLSFKNSDLPIILVYPTREQARNIYKSLRGHVAKMKYDRTLSVGMKIGRETRAGQIQVITIGHLNKFNGGFLIVDECQMASPFYINVFSNSVTVKSFRIILCSYTVTGSLVAAFKHMAQKKG